MLTKLPGCAGWSAPLVFAWNKGFHVSRSINIYWSFCVGCNKKLMIPFFIYLSQKIVFIVFCSKGQCRLWWHRGKAPHMGICTVINIYLKRFMGYNFQSFIFLDCFHLNRHYKSVFYGIVYMYECSPFITLGLSPYGWTMLYAKSIMKGHFYKGTIGKRPLVVIFL